MSQIPAPATSLAGRTTLGALFHNAALMTPDATALTDGERRSSYRELDARSSQLANRLAERGLAHGDRLALLAGNCAEYAEVELAAAKAGVIVAALNWRLGDRELQHCIDLVEPRLVITSAAHAPTLDRLRLGTMARVTIGPDYEAEIERGASGHPAAEFDPESGFVILYTSGTTGLPKGALISHRAMIARSMLFASELAIPHDDHFVPWTPMFHMASTDHALATLLRGGTVHMVDGFDADRIIDLIERHTMAWLPLVPGMIAQMNEALARRNAKPRGIGCIGAMPDLIRREELAEVTTRLNAPYLNSFGATETGLAPATASFVPIGAAPERLPKRQSAFCDVRLVDPDDNEVPTGEPGEVFLTGPTLFSGYWNADAVNAREFRGGRFHMGDVMRRNADGTLEYVDRAKYMIKSGGENIYPAEIEQVIAADERVETAVVVRRADARWGEVPVLFVVRRDASLDEAAIMARCDRDLSRYKRPRQILFVDDGDLPRSTTGKIQRHVLEERLKQA